MLKDTAHVKKQKETEKVSLITKVLILRGQALNILNLIGFYILDFTIRKY